MSTKFLLLQVKKYEQTYDWMGYKNIILTELKFESMNSKISETKNVKIRNSYVKFLSHLDFDLLT